MKTLKLYLGFDGSYVLSHRSLVKQEGLELPFLSYNGPSTGQIVDLDDREGQKLFGVLGLKPFEVVKLTISASEPKRARRRTK